MNKVMKNYKRKNMTSVITKGFFDVVQDDAQAIRIAVNHNALPGSGIGVPVISHQNSSGVMENDTYAGVGTALQNLITANNALYERRRIAWVKMQFIPKFNTVNATLDGSGISAVVNQPIYVVTDMNGLNNSLATITEAGIMTQLTGVKIKSLYRRFKVFRRSRKFPYAPKYLPSYTYASSDIGQESGLVNPGGRWFTANDTSLGTSNSDTPHTLIAAFGLDFDPGDELMTCVFEIKYVWADRRSNV